MLSALGIILLIIGSSFTPSENNPITSMDRFIVGIAFIFSCLLGLSMALRPNWLKGLFAKEKEKQEEKVPSQGLRIRMGHHPECEGFASHVLKIRDKTYCAGCLGLAIGANIGILLLFLYLIMPDFVNSMSSTSMITIGLLFIMMNFLIVAARNKNSIVHVISNIILVSGFFLFVIGFFEITKSLSYGLLAVIISFLLLDTRIQLSHWHHRRTCIQCPDSCKVYGA
jgi:hypothetical protein